MWVKTSLLAYILLSLTCCLHLSDTNVSPLLKFFGVTDKSLEREVWSKVRNNTGVRSAILGNLTDTEQFNKLVLNQAIKVIRQHPQYVKTLARQGFQGSDSKVDTVEKERLVRSILFDNDLVNMILMGNQTQDDDQMIVRKMATIVKSNPKLLRQIARTEFNQYQLGRTMSEQEKTALFSIIASRPQIASDNNATSFQIQTILADARKDPRLSRVSSSPKLQEMLKDYLS